VVIRLEDSQFEYGTGEGLGQVGGWNGIQPEMVEEAH
jgi:hypothetical protein